MRGFEDCSGGWVDEDACEGDVSITAVAMVGVGGERRVPWHQGPAWYLSLVGLVLCRPSLIFWPRSSRSADAEKDPVCV